jgi:hypothetical protein
MSTHAEKANKRRAERKRATFTAVVTNAISGKPIGHLGNLSASGMLLISTEAPRSDAIYQVNVTLPTASRLLLQSQPIEVGIQEQWHEAAATPGQIWAGYRIVAITDADAGRLESWLASA